MNYLEKIKNYIEDETKILNSLDINVINLIMNEIKASQERGSRVYICGNGGSASTASHYCCDFNKGVSG